MVSSLTLHLFTDGGSRGNPGPAATGFVFKTPSGELIHCDHRYLGLATNNIAEYQAIVDALDWLDLNRSILPPHQSLQVIFYADSTLIINQLKGSFKIKNSALAALAARIWSQIKSFPLTPQFIAIPRSQNSLADHEVNQALDAAALSGVLN